MINWFTTYREVLASSPRTWRPANAAGIAEFMAVITIPMIISGWIDTSLLSFTTVAEIVRIIDRIGAKS